jgi:branched-chain amino acid transport system permease protein
MTFFLTQLLLATPLVAAYTLFALGVVLIYRASRVLNLAHGVMAMIPAYIALVGVAAGAALGAGVEAVFVRRLRRVSPTAQTVGTVAVYGLGVAVVAKVFGTAPLRPGTVFGDGVILFGSGGISHGQLGLIAVSCLLTVLLFALFNFTSLGLAMRGSASNRTAAALVGVNPDRTTSVAWMMGGALAAVAGILLSAVSTLDPYGFPMQALPAFVAALIGGLGSMTGALGGSLVVGLTIGIVPGLSNTPLVGPFASSLGSSQAVLALVAFVVMALRGERLAASDVRSGALA